MMVDLLALAHDRGLRVPKLAVQIRRGRFVKKRLPDIGSLAGPLRTLVDRPCPGSNAIG